MLLLNVCNRFEILFSLVRIKAALRQEPYVKSSQAFRAQYNNKQKKTLQKN